MTDIYGKRRLVAGILLLIFFMIALIGEAMQDRATRYYAVVCGSVIGLAIALCLLIGAAHAHDHERPELNQWFMGLHSRNHGWCCDGSEAVHLRDVDWQTQNKNESHFRVKVPATEEDYNLARTGIEVPTIWVDVPDWAIIDDPNLEGSAMVWPYYNVRSYSAGGGVDVRIRCFLPGAEG